MGARCRRRVPRRPGNWRRAAAAVAGSPVDAGERRRPEGVKSERERERERAGGLRWSATARAFLLHGPLFFQAILFSLPRFLRKSICVVDDIVGLLACF
jgi:hypothetical protein